MPAWYRVIKAAAILQVPPWELLRQDVFWMEAALSARHAENKAQEAKRVQLERRRGRKAGTSRAAGRRR